MKAITTAVLSTYLLCGCATPGTQTLKTSDARECSKNFTYDGSFLAGRTYKTYATVKNVSQKDGMARAARYITNEGWSITDTKQDLGIISASQTVSYGDGKTVPLNITVEPAAPDVKVSITYSTSGGVTSPLEAITKSFCSTIEAVKGA